MPFLDAREQLHVLVEQALNLADVRIAKRRLALAWDRLDELPVQRRPQSWILLEQVEKEGGAGAWEPGNQDGTIDALGSEGAIGQAAPGVDQTGPRLEPRFGLSSCDDLAQRRQVGVLFVGPQQPTQSFAPLGIFARHVDGACGIGRQLSCFAGAPNRRLLCGQ